MGLGRIAALPLSGARRRATELRQLVRDGIDPIEQRAARRSSAGLAASRAMSFRQCAEAYIEAHRAGWRNHRHAAQWPSTLATYVYPTIGDLPVYAVDTGLVVKCLTRLWVTKSETASRVRGRIELILDWATASGYRRGENPARWRGHLENLLPKKSKVKRVEHHAALPYSAVGEFVA